MILFSRFQKSLESIPSYIYEQPYLYSLEDLVRVNVIDRILMCL